MRIYSPQILATYCKNTRKKQRLSQTQLGDRVGLKQATVSAFESNPDATKLSTLFRILAAANLELRIQARDSAETTEKWAEEW